ncbi:efflux RND transporter permease subunit [Vibrio tubiashii]|uniref:Hydrophobe/amphiphile efflux-1 family protein n=1 Tax=Vibrio tubiashii ATCC 19109 TaxID=1051646 RepID=F9T516_9VIBR|nr:efflux RND transporter permease subunit [Vibrio tubiashii]AIW16712.1 multidrug transporter [Vibrio tubiashii ATCC 19109]EGU55503.1 hydrophobe/amphiphile efflux-1 family protein [Vibrio tubiashii ATCC 19109]EIF02058.1 hydrophobe/amphiphile efflux-1 family protein [Vibrio tubiashii NCIMB 1337 = ATCC 19106]
MFKFFIRRPKLAIVISIFISIAGIVSAYLSPMGRYPDVAPLTIAVDTWMDGATAEVLTKTVAPEIEKQVNGVAGMQYMKSTSSADGTYSLEIVFENGTDADNAVTLVQNRVNLALPELPGDVMRNGVKVEKLSNGMLIGLSIQDPKGQATDTEISSFAGGEFKEALQRISGVSKIDVLGEKKYAMRIWLDPNKMRQFSVDVDAIQQAIATQNKISPAGSLVGDLLEYPLTVDGGLTTQEQFENIVVRGSALQRKVFLKDVAKIELGAEVYTANAYSGVNDGSVVFIYKTPDANAVEVGSAVADLLKELPTEYQIEYVYDATSFVHGAIDNVLETLLLAVLIVGSVTLIFMQSLRLTMITVTAIPVSLIGTFTFMYALGIDINIISMLGLVMAIGIVVDAAIIVIEAAEHEFHNNPNIAVKEAVELALDKVVAPIIASALVLLSVFAPTIFMSGMTGIIYSEFGIVLSVSVLVSTVVALSLTPALCALFMKPPKKGKLAQSVEKMIGYKISSFTFLTKCFVRFPLISLLLLGGGVWLAVEQGQELPQGMLPAEDTSAVFVVGGFEPGTALKVTDRYTLAAVEELQKIDGVKNSIAASGFNLLNGNADMSSFLILLNLDSIDERELSDEEITNKANEVLQEMEIEGFAFKPPVIPELGMVDGVNFVLVDQKGRSPEELNQDTQAILSKLNEMESVSVAMTQFAVNKPSIKLNIDRKRMLEYGISYADLVDGMQAHFGGQYVNTFNLNGRNYKVMMQNSPEHRLNEKALNNVYINYGNGQSRPANELFSIEEVKVPNFINRYNAMQSVSIDVLPSSSTGAVIADLQALDLPEGYSIEFTGTAKEEIEAGSQAVVILALALLITYLVLAGQYESWLIPAAIMAMVPTAVIGIIGGVSLLGAEVTIFTQLSAVLLVGMAVRNAILIVEYAKELREVQGLPLKTAAVEAMRLRARAVFMTAFSFAVGLVPLMMADAIGSGAQQALGWASFGGIVTATFLGCIAACIFFVVFQSIRERFKSPKLEACPQ